MSQENMIDAIVRKVLSELGSQNAQSETSAQESLRANANVDQKRLTAADYPIAEKRPDLVKTKSGKGLGDITLEAVESGAVTFEDIHVTPQILEYQAQIGESVGRPQIALNLRRAAELIDLPDNRILEIYDALRPNRSTKAELIAIADELEQKYSAGICSKFVREAAEVYEKRGILRKD